jgi:hypothetical protein
LQETAFPSYEIHRAINGHPEDRMVHGSSYPPRNSSGLIHDGACEGETVEVDETYIGGTGAEHAQVKTPEEIRRWQAHGRLWQDCVFGLLERGTKESKSRVRTKVIDKFTMQAMHWQHQRRRVARNHSLFDEFGGYTGLGAEGRFQHDFIAHAKEYVRGNVHTN